MADLLPEAYSQFDQYHDPLEWDDPRRVPLNDDAVRGTYYSCVDQLCRGVELRVERDYSTQVFTGFIGSGKSSELKLLAHQLRQRAYEVVFIDTEDFLNLKVAPTISDLLVTIAGGMDRYLKQALPPDRLRPLKDFWSRFTSFLSSKVSVQGFSLDVGVASLDLDLKRNLQFRERLNAALDAQGRIPTLAKECQDFLDEAVALLRANSTQSKGVVLIVDSFEKVGHPYITEEIIRAVQAICTRDWDLLRAPCHAIYTVPPWITFLEFGADSAFGRVQMLPMCKLADRQTGDPYPPGIRLMMELLSRRAPLDKLFAKPEASLTPLIMASGGYPRDLLRMMREVILAISLGMEKDPSLHLPLPAAKAKKIVAREIQRNTDAFDQALTDENLEMIVQVGRARHIHSHREQDLWRLAHLFQHHFVLAYQNDQPWFDLHPLVRRSRKVQEALSAPNEPPPSVAS